MASVKQKSKSKNTNSENLHAEHRKRLRNRFRMEGLESFEPHNILELILFYVLARIDTNPLAHKLLNEFGSFSGVIDAPYESLLQVDGVGESVATFIKMIHDVIRIYELDKFSHDGLSDLNEIAQYMVQYYKNQTEESLVILLLDNSDKLFKVVKVCDGTVNELNLPTRKISNILHRYNASSYILVHNHPSGIAAPSQQDIAITIKMDSVLNALNFKIREHIIVAGKEYCFAFKDISPNKNLSLIPR